MIAIKNGKIELFRFKITANKGGLNCVRYAFTEDEKDGILTEMSGKGFDTTDEEIAVAAGELLLEGKECGSIATAKEWLALGYAPKTETEILRETLDALVISILGV